MLTLKLILLQQMVKLLKKILAVVLSLKARKQIFENDYYGFKSFCYRNFKEFNALALTSILLLAISLSDR